LSNERQTLSTAKVPVAKRTIHRIYSGVPEARSDKLALAGVLALWAGMTGVVLGCIAIYGHNVPLAEDWVMVPPLVGREPNLLQWLWAQNNEHRLPLQKAVYLVLLKASGGDFRIGMLANTLMLAGLCLAMIVTARRLRGGQTRLADAFFPLALLHLGHWENMVWGWQIQFVISTGLVCVWLLVIVRENWPLPPKPALAAGLTLVLLPLSGANGLLFTPFVALWLAIGTLLYRGEMTATWLTPFLSACVIISIALSGLYFIGYVQPQLADAAHPASWPPNPGLRPTALTGARFVGMAIGPAGGGRVPARLISLFCPTTILLVASSAIPLVQGLGQVRKSERFRIFGLLVFAAAMAALVVVMAWGRAGWVPIQDMPDRYALLSVPGLCAAYFVWVLYGSETVRDRIAIGFAITSLFALPFNLREGNSWRQWYVSGMRAFDHDLSARLSWQDLGDKHYKFLMHWNRDALVERMRMLHDAKIGPLGRAAPG
jgi:hypothetical protein